MAVDLKMLVTILTLIMIGPIAWIVRSVVADVKEIAKDLADHKTRVAENYVEKDDLHRELGEIKDMLKQLFTLAQRRRKEPE